MTTVWGFWELRQPDGFIPACTVDHPAAADQPGSPDYTDPHYVEPNPVRLYNDGYKPATCDPRWDCAETLNGKTHLETRFISIEQRIRDEKRREVRKDFPPKRKHKKSRKSAKRLTPIQAYYKETACLK
jgi:hypothetical protein